jgi:hypothetical protein
MLRELQALPADIDLMVYNRTVIETAKSLGVRLYEVWILEDFYVPSVIGPFFVDGKQVGDSHLKDRYSHKCSDVFFRTAIQAFRFCLAHSPKVVAADHNRIIVTWAEC